MRWIMICIAIIAMLFAPMSEGVTTQIDLRPIRPLLCGNYVGTGEIIAPDMIMTAAHVVGNATVCHDRANLAKGRVFLSSRSQDIAIVKFPPNSLPDSIMPYSCDPFVKDQHYLAYGWALGEDFMGNIVTAHHVYLVLTDGDLTLFHLASLDGLIIQGMSGGPIVDSQGVMHGMNTMTQYPDEPNNGFSRELHDTFMCHVYPPDLLKGAE